MNTLQIRTTNAKLAIESTRATVTIERTSPQLTVKRTPAAMQFRATGATFQINKAVLPVTGNPTQSGAVAQHAKLGMEALQRFTIRTIDEGNEMMEINKKENPVPSIAVSRQNSRKGELNIGPNPQSANSIEWEQPSFDMDWTADNLEISWSPLDAPKITVTPHSVKIYMQQWPQVEISVVEGPEYEPIIDEIL